MIRTGHKGAVKVRFHKLRMHRCGIWNGIRGRLDDGIGRGGRKSEKFGHVTHPQEMQGQEQSKPSHP